MVGLGRFFVCIGQRGQGSSKERERGKQGKHANGQWDSNNAKLQTNTKPSNQFTPVQYTRLCLTLAMAYAALSWRLSALVGVCYRI